MPRKKYEPISFVAQVKAIINAGLDKSPAPNREIDSEGKKMSSLDDRLSLIFDITNKTDRQVGNMLFFVMYDIENNRVRNMVFKYLQKQGCSRIQKSIFLADLPPEKYETIKHDLEEVQAAYENADSILVVPISTDYLKSMKIIGKNISLDVITKSKNTLFF